VSFKKSLVTLTSVETSLQTARFIPYWMG